MFSIDIVMKFPEIGQGNGFPTRLAKISGTEWVDTSYVRLFFWTTIEERGERSFNGLIFCIMGKKSMEMFS